MIIVKIYMYLLYFLCLKKNNAIFKEKDIGKQKNVKDNCNATLLICHPEFAVDGNHRTFTYQIRDFDYDTFSNIFRYEPYYWIQIDLTDIYWISRVLLNIDEMDISFSNREHSFVEIYISNDNSTIFANKNVYNKFMIEYKYIYNTTGDATYGRYLTVKYNHSILKIAEIQIFSKIINVEKFNATQSSILYSKLIANFAIDNDLKTCAYTETSPSWWKIDLEKNYIIQEIEINSESAYPGLFPLSISVIISISNKNDKLCNYFNGTYSTAIKRIIKCLKPTDGRYVTIKNTNNDGNLILCDIQIYAILSNITTIENCNSQLNNSNICQIEHNNWLQNLIIGVVVGVGLLILITLLIIFICYYKNKKYENTSRTTVVEEHYETVARKLETSENVEEEHTYEKLGNKSLKLKDTNV